MKLRARVCGALVVLTVSCDGTKATVEQGALPPDITNSLRGTVTVVANVDSSMGLSSVELRLAGKSVETHAVPAASSSAPMSAVTLTVNTAAKDAGGAALYPNGPQTLAAVGTRRPWAPGCPAGMPAIQQALTLANP